ncbi:MAG: pseudouridine synthase [Eubacteriales bacterium]|nr:pseudouridine synthase [Eubacteriales bacterium]MDY3332432.1 pseudouridine synthase [Gallibacter sp.]
MVIENFRLNKYIASSGLCSRRKADDFIKNGNVKVNGVVTKDFSLQISTLDKVEVNGKPIIPEVEKLYYALNKPVGFITSMDDQFDRPTVAELVKNIPARLFPVGRLDNDTSGLIIMTNDGELSQQLAHPKHKTNKTYLAVINGVISDKKLRTLKNGVDIGGFVTSPCEAEITKQTKTYSIIKITIHEGKNRQVRKMFTAIGFKVLELKRISIGNLPLGRLKEGHLRKLDKTDLELLKGNM